MAISTLSGNWVVDLEQRIFKKVSDGLEERYGSNSSYSDLTVVYNNYNITEPKFPTVYIHALEPVENLKFLDGYDTPGVLYTIQVEVTDTDNHRCRNVAAATLKILQKMMFRVPAYPTQDNTEDTYKMIFRARRSISKSESSL